MKNQLANPELKNVVNSTTHFRVDWKDWKKEQPESGQSIMVVIRLENGYYPAMANYTDEILQGTRWQKIQLHDSAGPMIFLGTRDANRLIAWGYLMQIKY